MQTITLGGSALVSSVIGHGCNHLVDTSDTEALATVEEALDLGINHFDSANVYGLGRGETFLGHALKGRRDEALVISKFGIFPPAWGGDRRVNGSPEYCHQACEESLSRLGLDHIDLYYLHRVDPEVPIEDSIGAMVELKEAGKVRALGVCNATAEDVRRAHATHPLACVQVEYSLLTRDPEHELLPTCKELGITFVAYGPLAYAFVSGEVQSLADIPPEDGWRRGQPRFQDENIGHNLGLLSALEDVAKESGATKSQVALAWCLFRGYDIIPIPGTTKRTHLRENAKAADLRLTPAQVARLDDAFPLGAAKGGTR